MGYTFEHWDGYYLSDCDCTYASITAKNTAVPVICAVVRTRNRKRWNAAESTGNAIGGTNDNVIHF
jgi:hypothetical protein